MGIESILETVVGAGPSKASAQISVNSNVLGQKDSLTVGSATVTNNSEWEQGSTAEATAQNILQALQASVAAGEVDFSIDEDDLTKINLVAKSAGLAGNSIILEKEDSKTASYEKTFLAGDAERNTNAFYGVFRNYSSVNKPGAVEFCGMVVDPNNDDIFVFGGFGRNETAQGDLNGLFHFKQSEQKWSWVAGSKLTNQLSVFTGATLFPGARDAMNMWWLNNKIYIGFGFGYDVDSSDPHLNDLWSIDPYNDYETEWLGGSQQGSQNGSLVTGLGIHDSGNWPGGRQLAAQFTYGGKLFLVGGQGYGLTTGSGYLIDIWAYLPGSGWACYTSNNEVNPTADYGSKGVEAPTNQPSGVFLCGAWGVNNKVYVYGGEVPGGNLTNILWSFDLTSLQFTWETGSSSPNQPGIYDGAGATPGARQLSSYALDEQDRLLLHGGFGYDETQEAGFLNDFMRYDPSTGLWEFLFGDRLVDQPATYTPQGSESAEGSLGGRRYNPMVFGPISNSAFVFGGNAYNESGTFPGDSNDLWKITLGAVDNFTLTPFSGGLDGDEEVTMRWLVDDDGIFHCYINDVELFNAPYKTIANGNLKTLQENLTCFLKLART